MGAYDLPAYYYLEEPVQCLFDVLLLGGGSFLLADKLEAVVAVARHQAIVCEFAQRVTG